MTPSSRSPHWEHVRHCEDLLALLCECRDHARVLYIQGWREGSWDAVYDEAVALRHKLNLIHSRIVDTWPILHEAARQADQQGDPPCS